MASRPTAECSCANRNTCPLWPPERCWQSVEVPLPPLWSPLYRKRAALFFWRLVERRERATSGSLLLSCAPVGTVNRPATSITTNPDCIQLTTCVLVDVRWKAPYFNSDAQNGLSQNGYGWYICYNTYVMIHMYDTYVMIHWAEVIAFGILDALKTIGHLGKCEVLRGMSYYWSPLIMLMQNCEYYII